MEHKPGQLALFGAIERGDVQGVERLLRMNMAVGIRDEQGRTPLQYAIALGNDTIAARLKASLTAVVMVKRGSPSGFLRKRRHLIAGLVVCAVAITLADWQAVRRDDGYRQIASLLYADLNARVGDIQGVALVDVIDDNPSRCWWCHTAWYVFEVYGERGCALAIFAVNRRLGLPLSPARTHLQTIRPNESYAGLCMSEKPRRPEVTGIRTVGGKRFSIRDSSEIC